MASWRLRDAPAPPPSLSPPGLQTTTAKGRGNKETDGSGTGTPRMDNAPVY